MGLDVYHGSVVSGYAQTHLFASGPKGQFEFPNGDFDDAVEAGYMITALPESTADPGQ